MLGEVQARQDEGRQVIGRYGQISSLIKAVSVTEYGVPVADEREDEDIHQDSETQAQILLETGESGVQPRVSVRPKG